jgi:myo-inositol-1(or 4)-monophosphatase
MSSRLHVETKSSPTDLVSQVDRDAERLIVDRLAAARPHDSMLAEEGALSDGASGVRWIIDPLDGTTNYVYGYPAYCVSIAVEIDGRTQIGVVYDSSADHLYQGAVGFGAVRDGAALAIREGADLPRSLVATGFSYLPERRARQGDVAARIIGRVRDIRRGGSAALDLCRVAAGQVDAFYELYLNPWDYAAGRVIAMEAGADVVLLEPEATAADTESASASSDRGPAVIAASPSLMPAFLSLLRAADALTPV